jgi:hypothetical protein
VKAVRLVIQNREVAMDSMMKFSELNRGLAPRTYDGMIGTFMTNGLVDEETQKNDLVREVLKVTNEMPIAHARKTVPIPRENLQLHRFPEMVNL